MRASPCRRLDPVTFEVVEILRGRAYQPSKVKFWRRLLALKRAAAAAAIKSGMARHQTPVRDTAADGMSSDLH